ncbi:MAG: hypothetical protein KDM91_12995 [Verrucomicrobiae bacterium]|nr:hypothetical protein [Verrucomicrobiae bacterium]MCP5539331.1 hypothetical protein [Akkermansiaceae bacterium]MCP5549716.1 hypothetical protein [Akkermansiaceae bacterium]
MSAPVSPSSAAAKDLIETARADVWLWAVRLFKTRTQAADACRLGRVRCQGQAVKPSRALRVGDELTVETESGDLVRTVAVRAVLKRRVGAKLVADFLEDRTPPELCEAAAARRRERALAEPEPREAGTGRPSKKERRDLDEVLAEAEDREALYRKFDRAFRAPLWMLAFLSLAAVFGGRNAAALDFEPKETALSFKISENLIVFADEIAPETDAATGALTGLAAVGGVVIKAKPEGAPDWVLVRCDKATYNAAGDEVILTGSPAVKSGPQILRATSDETYVRVARASGKWEIKGPHKIELNLGGLKKKK